MLVVREERESKLVRLSSCCLCLAFLSLVLASTLPMFVVTSLEGHGKLVIGEFNVDVKMGDGLWKRNVCFGGSLPDEDLLQKFGLTCKGALQTEGCEDNPDLSDKQQEHCDQFYLLQGMESLAIFSTFIATFLGSLARACGSWSVLRVALRLSTVVAVLISLAAASSVVRLVKESDMVDERTFSCSNIFGAELCHGYGASWGLQGAAIGELSLALLVNVLLVCVAPVTTTTSYQYVRVPLLQQQQQMQQPVAPIEVYPPRVIIAAPGTTQGVVLSRDLSQGVVISAPTNTTQTVVNSGARGSTTQGVILAAHPTPVPKAQHQSEEGV